MWKCWLDLQNFCLCSSKAQSFMKLKLEITIIISKTNKIIPFVSSRSNIKLLKCCYNMKYLWQIALQNTFYSHMNQGLTMIFSLGNSLYLEATKLQVKIRHFNITYLWLLFHLIHIQDTTFWKYQISFDYTKYKIQENLLAFLLGWWNTTKQLLKITLSVDHKNI